jgi:hypothetical protein
MRGSQHVFESIGASRQKGSGLIRDYGRNGCRGSVESCTPADGEYPGPWAA